MFYYRYTYKYSYLPDIFFYELNVFVLRLLTLFTKGLYLNNIEFNLHNIYYT